MLAFNSLFASVSLFIVLTYSNPVDKPKRAGFNPVNDEDCYLLPSTRSQFPTFRDSRAERTCLLVNSEKSKDGEVGRS